MTDLVVDFDIILCDESNTQHGTLKVTSGPVFVESTNESISMNSLVDFQYVAYNQD